MKTKIAIAINPELLARIDKMAARFELSRSQFIENLLSTGLDDAEGLSAIGVVDLIKTLANFKDKLKSSVGLRDGAGKKVLVKTPLRRL